MSIFVDQNTRIIVQGITGKEGSFWTGHMLDMGATVVAGVTPGKEGQEVRGVPVYHSVARARAAHTADAAMLFVPPKFTKDAVFEALDAGIGKIVTIADGIPGARLEIIPTAGHLSTVDAPDAVTQVLESYLASVAGS